VPGKSSKHNDKPKSQPKQHRKATDWNLESPYDAPATLQELVELAPFRDASDSKGGSFTAAARVPVWLERKIMWFIEMKGSPYQLKGDVVRDMVYLGARVLHARYKGNPDWATEAKMTEAVNQVGVIQHVKAQVEQLSKGIKVLWDEGDESQAIEGLERYIAAVSEMRDDWQKTKILQYLKGNRDIRYIIESCSDEVKRLILS